MNYFPIAIVIPDTEFAENPLLVETVDQLPAAIAFRVIATQLKQVAGKWQGINKEGATIIIPIYRNFTGFNLQQAYNDVDYSR